MIKLLNSNIVETSYEPAEEAKNASLFGIGNGYYGIRGSFEEFGDVYVQGTYIRGAFDQIIEIPPALSSNLYMKQYYFDEEKLKEFEYEDSCINICDFTSLKIYVDGELCLPWSMKIVSWRRHLNFADGSLIRNVVYEDKKGRKTRLIFHKIPCFNDNHYFLQYMEVELLNHHASVVIESGVDTLVKTNGQKKSVLKDVKQSQERSVLSFYLGDKYKQEVSLAFSSSAIGADYIRSDNKDGVYFDAFKVKADKATIYKIVYVSASVDKGYNKDLLSTVPLDDFKGQYQKHLKAYKDVKAIYQIKIANKEYDTYLNYANYQTIIGLDRYDEVHSLSAKNLTSEKYNQFVWWDAEIFQMPAFNNAFPEASKHALMYRVNRLEAAKKLALANGYKGAKFPFCSSVKGDENVWIYARHPFMQIHISSDVCYSLIAYFKATNDVDFLLDKGFELLIEVIKFFVSRSTLKDGKYQFLTITGTDEHHDYVNNDAYTNYEVEYVVSETLRLIDKYHYSKIDKSLLLQFKDFKDNLYLPVPNKRGIIPQFDGYFSLKTFLPIEGKVVPGFQMKQAGLYQLSQIIKQPDVVMLYSYLNLPAPGSYKNSFHFYEKKCEASSSLTYPVHGLCAVDNHEISKFNDYFLKSLKMDFLDIFGGAKQGIHAGSLAGGRIMIIRGLAGFKNEEDALCVKPQYDSVMGEIKFSYLYHGNLMEVTLNRKGLFIKPKQDLNVSYQGTLTICPAGKLSKFALCR
jgi:trehalose/maltose hydrolase-like predicted phosphorylase